MRAPAIRFAWSILLVLISKTAVAGQFVSLIPEPRSDTVARTISVRSAIRETLTAIVNDCASSDDPLRCREHRRNELSAAAREFCTREHFGNQTLVDRCIQNAEDVLPQVISFGRTAPRTWYVPLRSGQEGLVRFYERASEFRFLSKFAANMRDDQIFVLSDIVSGAIDIIPFSIATATVVTKNDTASISPDNVVEGVTSDLTRLINNGGTLTARAVIPLLVSEGTNVRSTTATYVQGGVIGPLSTADSLRLSGAWATESVVGFAIRRPDSTAEHIADLVIGIRLVRSFSEDPIASGFIDRRGFWTWQFGLGFVDKSGQLSLSFLLTHPFNDKVRDRIPRIMLNLAALRQ
jgi:hypothetical protein